MAQFSVEGLDDLMKDLSDLEFDRIAPMMLEEAVPILEKNVKRRAAFIGSAEICKAPSNRQLQGGGGMDTASACVLLETTGRA